jgi:hypothetical protein
MSPTYETPLQRIHRIFADTSERVLRDMYRGDRNGDPPPNAIRFAREMVTLDKPPSTEASAALARLPDEDIAAMFENVAKPKILAAFAEVRPS